MQGIDHCLPLPTKLTIMNKQTIKFTAFLVLGWMACLHATIVCGQSTLVADGNLRTIAYSGGYVEYLVPNNADGKWLYLKASGGDGSNGTNADGGKGATVESFFRIGSDAFSIPGGSTIRFIVGGKGAQRKLDGQKFGGGGGGTAVALKRAGEDTWTVQIVAGGGGGAGCTTGAYKSGREGQSSPDGSDGYKDSDENHKYSNAGTDGQAGGSGDRAGGGGGSISSADGCGGKSGANSNYEPVGSQGGSCDNCAAGGFGYGSGGAGAKVTTHDAFGIADHDHNGGGGGGYSGGGGGGNGGGGGGGGSFSRPGMQYFLEIERHGTTSSPEDGYVQYRMIDLDSDLVAIRFAGLHQSKCIDDRNARLANGNNIQLWDCNDSPAQSWILDGLAIRSGLETTKCLDLNHSNTDNETNIHLWDCNGTNAQKWIYDGISRLFRSRINQRKCLDLDMIELPYNATNVQLWDCTGLADQQWVVDGATTVNPSDEYNRIRYVKGNDQCIDVQSASIDNGANVQILQCQDADSQYWYFADDFTIRFHKKRSKCLDLNHSSTDNGNNIQLFDCNNTNAQKWTYDGIYKSFRSWVNPEKCLDVVHSGTEDHTNIQIFDCNGTDAQQFEIY